MPPSSANALTLDEVDSADIETSVLDEDAVERDAAGREVAQDDTVDADATDGLGGAGGHLDDGSATIVEDGLFPGATLREVDENLARYAGRGVLGEGGMGEVRLYRDLRMGRDVAMKVLLPGRAVDPHARARFLREALIQGALEHPAIVPVHDIGETSGGEPYFTMKRIRGHTLEHIVRGLKSGSWGPRDYPLRRLLSAFARACEAVDFAHAQGVVHRDIKPANIMLGDFGEVYLLDWGVARVGGAAEALVKGLPLPVAGTGEGSTLGTPGYLAPEQIRAPSEVDGRADIYSLGAILFELLTHERLHAEDAPHVMLTEALHGGDARARARAPDKQVPAELESICIRATRRDPDERFQTARELRDAIESYLEGHQHQQRRKKMADVHAQAARDAHVEARDQPERAEQLHTHAMREAGLALALDPDHEGALRTVIDLLVKPPAGLPPEAARALTRSRGKLASLGMRILALGRYTWLVYLPLILWMGLANAGLVVVILSLAMAAGVFQHWVAGVRRPSQNLLHFAAVINVLTVMPMGFVFGPLWLTPLIVVASVPAMVLYLDGRGRVLVHISAAVTIALPAILEWVGWWPASYFFEDGRMVIESTALVLEETPTRVFLLVSAIGASLTSIHLVAGVRDYLARTEARLHRQAWQLRQLLPRPNQGDTTVTGLVGKRSKREKRATGD